MALGIFAAIALSLFLAWSISRADQNRVQTSSIDPASPLDEAELILAARYARGVITRQEYDDMLVILRR
ncbi:MAG: hypothetical protein CVT67_09620 [Actinobacteria bacterium HGW-Actinobacteria-7]|nr:MAG: hypothetical protein CVU63_06675 [Deltaproteobacteria bacterium HGW-Deltaproteobacteria-20]PKQ15385.1 MAG: hypothetical protein CVT67_09620 [Actinobacteria bacterium HGW-Actinobacteria-7]